MLSAEYNHTIKTYGCQFQSLSNYNKKLAIRSMILYNSSNDFFGFFAPGHYTKKAFFPWYIIPYERNGSNISFSFTKIIHMKKPFCQTFFREMYFSA